MLGLSKSRKVTARSRKNSAVTSDVWVTVKRRPARKEKECSYTWQIYRHYFGGERAEVWSREDLQELRRKAKETDSGTLTVLNRYREVDFEKEAVFFFKFEVGLSDGAKNHRVTSCATSLDGNGKLKCTVKVQYQTTPQSPDVAYPGVLEDYIIALTLAKKDAAMIDYFDIELEKLP